MGITKAQLFTTEQNDFARVAKGFAHPARVAIIQYLLKANACINNDLIQELGLAQATISQHLRELKEIGIIRGSIEGASMSYCIDPDRWCEISGMFNGMFDEYQGSPQIECC